MTESTHHYDQRRIETAYRVILTHERWDMRHLLPQPTAPSDAAGGIDG